MIKYYWLLQIKTIKSLILLLFLFVSGCQISNFNNKNNYFLIFHNFNICNNKLFYSTKSFICKKKQFKSNVIIVNIKFNSDSFKLNNQAKKILNQFCCYLKLNNEPKLIIKGYSGKIESRIITNKNILTNYNIILSKKRAINVKKYIINKLPNYINNIIIEGLGYQDPIAPNDSFLGRSMNQRVEINLKK